MVASTSPRPSYHAKKRLHARAELVAYLKRVGGKHGLLFKLAVLTP